MTLVVRQAARFAVEYGEVQARFYDAMSRMWHYTVEWPDGSSEDVVMWIPISIELGD